MRRRDAPVKRPASPLAEVARVMGYAMSDGEVMFLGQCRQVGLPTPTPQARLVPGRLYRTDFALADYGIAIEIEGGAFSQVSRHRSGSGFTADCRKYDEIALLGWMLLRVTTEMVTSGEAVALVERAIAARQRWASQYGVSPAIAIPERVGVSKKKAS